MERDTLLQSFLLHFPSESPVNEPPSMFSNRVPMEREASSPGPMVYHSFISVTVPNKEPSHEKRGKHLVTIHGAPHGRKAYIQWGMAWFPKGIVYDTAISTPVPCSLHHNTFHLGLGRPEPRYPACVVATLIRVCPPQLLPPPT
jgi:hypothetical protein